jgi:hypothetical protein
MSKMLPLVSFVFVLLWLNFISVSETQHLFRDETGQHALPQLEKRLHLSTIPIGATTTTTVRPSSSRYHGASLSLISNACSQPNWNDYIDMYDLRNCNLGPNYLRSH